MKESILSCCLLLIVTVSSQLSFILENPKPTTESLPACTYANGKFVAVGSNRVVVTSSDLSSWVARRAQWKEADKIPEVDFLSICFNKGYFIAGGNYCSL